MKIENVYLQSFEKNAEVLDIPNFTTLRKEDDSIRTNGWYMYVAGILSYILFDKTDVFLVFDKSIFKIDKESKAKYVEAEVENIFELYQGDKLVLTMPCPKIEGDFEEDVLGFNEKEDFDWGLFLKNIINSRIRQKNIFERIDKEN